MKKCLSIIIVAFLLLSSFPTAVSAEDQRYTFTLDVSATELKEGDTLTVSLTISGCSFNAYSTIIQYGTRNQDALVLLDCTAPYSVNETAHTVSLRTQGNALYESGTTVAVLTFGVRDIERSVSPTVMITSAHADISNNAISENAKEAVKQGNTTITCKPVVGAVNVDVSVKSVPADAGTAWTGM